MMQSVNGSGIEQESYHVYTMGAVTAVIECRLRLLDGYENIVMA
jgi:hypothetical protein